MMMKMPKFFKFLMQVALICALMASPTPVSAGPAGGVGCYTTCMIACNSMGAAAFTALVVASGGAAAAGIPTGAAATIAGCSQVCMPISAACLWFPSM
jgi:hypothetical protein